ncbi:hypothetical protein C2S52_011113 [Perilla frutescens var. hirtella]|nr:hypothetical protein C2S52_011113 [Perilla frutescens var. hirtella]
MSHHRGSRVPEAEVPTPRGGRTDTRNTTRGAQISVRGNFGKVISQVRGRLNRANVDAFRGTCFGHLIDMPDIQAQGQLVYFMLTHLEPESEVRNRLCFSINGRRVQLGPQEFYCLSGLQFNEAGEPPASSDMHRDIFLSKPFMKAHDIDKAFETYSDVHRGAGSLVLKLAMLHIVFGLLLNRDQLSKLIQLEYLHLIDDYETFNNFPWGKIFAFKVMPRLASHCAHRIPETLFPRFMHWTADQFFKASALAPFFNDNAPDSTIQFLLTWSSMVPFVLTSAEIMRLENVGLTHDESSPPPVARRFSLIDEDDITENEPELEVVGSRAARALEVCQSPRKHVGSASSSRSKSRPLDRSSEPSKKKSIADDGAPATLVAISRMIVDSNALVMARMDSLDKAIKLVEQKVDALYKGHKHRHDGEDYQHQHDSEDYTSARDQLSPRSENYGDAGVDTNMPDADMHGNVADTHGDTADMLSGPVDRVMANTFAEADERKETAGDAEKDDREASDGVETQYSDADNVADIHSHAADINIADIHGHAADMMTRPADKLVSVDGAGVIDMSKLVELVAEACKDIDPAEEEFVAEDVDDDVLRAVDAYTDAGSGGEAVDTDVDISFLSEEESNKGEAPPATKKLPVKMKLFIPKARPYAREQPSHKKMKSSRARAKSKKHREPPMLAIMSGKYVVVREYDWKVVKPFHEWYEKGLTLKPPPRISLPVECKRQCDAPWFKGLWTARGWLDNDQTLVLENMDEVRDRITPYVDGNYPQQGGKPWWAVNMVYGMGHVSHDHWVLYMLHFASEAIVVFDPISKHCKD